LFFCFFFSSLVLSGFTSVAEVKVCTFCSILFLFRD
jgi:hypothetical protein